MLPITLRLTCIIYDEYNDSANHVEVTINEDRIKWILEVNEALEKLKAYSINDFNCDTKYLYYDEDESTWSEPDFSVDTELLTVRKNEIYWSCLVKDNNAPVESETIEIGLIKELYRIAKLPIDEMPMYINGVKKQFEYSNENKHLLSYVSDRMKKGE
jgi:hypothetical protein